MKIKKIVLCLLLVFAFFMTSCDKQENLTNNENGSNNEEVKDVYYSVKFYDQNGNVIDTRQVKEGESIEKTMEDYQTDEYNYLFIGWDKSLENIKSNLEVHPEYEKVKRKYKVEFVLTDELELISGDLVQYVEYGEKAITPEIIDYTGKYDFSLIDNLFIFKDTKIEFQKDNIVRYEIKSNLSGTEKIAYSNVSNVSTKIFYNSLWYEVKEIASRNLFKDINSDCKVIMIHSNQRGTEKEENIKLLLDVEKESNPIEIVIHVNILKEGWDVNNLYTIVPLRTAASKTLREQTIGRGLRLPFGKRTGIKLVDSVTITAHDKFDEIIAEAQSGNSIFKTDGIIYADYSKKKTITPVQISFLDNDEERGNILEKAGLDHNNEEHRDLYNNVIAIVTTHVNQKKKNNPNSTIHVEDIKNDVEKDLGQRYNENSDLTSLLATLWNMPQIDEKIEQVSNKVMYIPKIKTESLGTEKYIIKDFDLDISKMIYTPIENDIMIKDLLDSQSQIEIIKGDLINFDVIRPEKFIVENIRNISEIDYEKCPELIQKITMQFLNYYRSKYSEDKVKNICLMYKKDIVEKLKEQLLQHLAISYDGIVEVVQDIETIVNDVVIDVTEGIKNINEAPEGENIKSLVYNGSLKSVTTPFKFDSNPERLFAISCDNSPEVIQWLRPSSKQFNITYNRGQRYEPDFVVETSDMYYLVEVKDKTKMNDPVVIAKKERAIQYCKLASEYNVANGHKPFKYLFIPHDQVSTNSSFNNLKSRFIEE